MEGVGNVGAWIITYENYWQYLDEAQLKVNTDEKFQKPLSCGSNLQHLQQILGLPALCYIARDKELSQT